MKRLFLIIVSIICILSLLAGCTANDAWQDDFYTTGTIYSWNGTAFVPLGTGGGGTNDHSALVNLDYASAGHTGFEPAIGYTGNPLQYLNGMGNFAIPAGGAGGNVTSSANLTDNTIIRGDGGVLGIQDSGVTIDDFDNLNTNGGDIDAFDINAGNDVNVTNDLDVTDDADIGGQLVVTGNISAQGNYVLTTDNVNDVPANGVLDEPISSNWAYDLTHADATGSTFPVSPWIGQTFLHTPTGRTILYVYDGVSWGSLQSIGSITIYVDSTDGTDDTSHGTAANASAFKTVQYAIDTIPGLVGGNVIIYINDETYSEDVVIRGKNTTGNYSITIYGTLTVHESHNQTASVQGATTTFGSISDTTNDPFAGHSGDLLYSSNNAEYRVITTVTTEVATITGYWTAAPSGSYTIYQWGTQVRGLTIDCSMLCNVYDIYLNQTSSGYSLYTTRYTNSNYYRCKFSDTGRAVVYYAIGLSFFTDCYFYTTDATYLVYTDAQIRTGMTRVSFVSTVNSGMIAYVTRLSNIILNTIYLNGQSGANKVNYGFYCDAHAVANFNAAYNQISYCDTGVFASLGAQGNLTSNNQYSNNGTNESATAASYGYID